MQRIETLLQKLTDLAQRGNKNGVIEIDLMMDYTRVLYADLIEWRARSVFNTSLETEGNNENKVITAATIPAIQPNNVQTEHTVMEEMKMVIEEPEEEMAQEEYEPIEEEEEHREQTIAEDETQPEAEEVNAEPADEVPFTIEPVTQHSEPIKQEPHQPIAETQKPQPKPSANPQLFTELPKRKDIRRQIGINDKYQIISELFSNDKEAYEAMLDKVNGFTSYDETVQWLKNNTYKQYNWQEDSAGLMILYGILMLFFSDNK